MMKELFSHRGTETQRKIYGQHSFIEIRLSILFLVASLTSCVPIQDTIHTESDYRELSDSRLKPWKLSNYSECDGAYYLMDDGHTNCSTLHLTFYAENGLFYSGVFINIPDLAEKPTYSFQEGLYLNGELDKLISSKGEKWDLIIYRCPDRKREIKGIKIGNSLYLEEAL